MENTELATTTPTTTETKMDEQTARAWRRLIELAQVIAARRATEGGLES